MDDLQLLMHFPSQIRNILNPWPRMLRDMAPLVFLGQVVLTVSSLLVTILVLTSAGLGMASSPLFAVCLVVLLVQISNLFQPSKRIHSTLSFHLQRWRDLKRSAGFCEHGISSHFPS